MMSRMPLTVAALVMAWAGTVASGYFPIGLLVLVMYTIAIFQKKMYPRSRKEAFTLRSLGMLTFIATTLLLIPVYLTGSYHISDWLINQSLAFFGGLAIIFLMSVEFMTVGSERGD
jgi:hypothetical protein